MVFQPVFAAPEAPRTPLGAGPDLMPAEPESRARVLAAAAFDATIYGTSAYLQYEQLHRQVFDQSAENHTGFNRFFHERHLAGPAYKTFKVPNADTLYSTAWINLVDGPIEIEIPATGLKYFTLNVFDIFGNPSNLSNRTIGFGGARVLFVPPGWRGEAPAGATLYESATVHLWILMRAFAQTPDEVAEARRFQDSVAIKPCAPSAKPSPPPPFPADGARGLLRALDYILRVNGCQPGEEALVSRFRVLGVLAGAPFDAAAFDAPSLAAIEAGYRDAAALMKGAKSQLGVSTGTGWMKVDKGVYGYNYLRRSVINTAGLGANVREENASYTTFHDREGKPLDASRAAYVLRLETPPPVDAFWSATLYDAATFALYANPLGRYLISDRTENLAVERDGSITINISHAQGGKANWLPAPSGPLFIVLRAYSPRPEMLDGRWLPPPIVAVG